MVARKTAEALLKDFFRFLESNQLQTARVLYACFLERVYNTVMFTANRGWAALQEGANLADTRRLVLSAQTRAKGNHLLQDLVSVSEFMLKGISLPSALQHLSKDNDAMLCFIQGMYWRSFVSLSLPFPLPLSLPPSPLSLSLSLSLYIYIYIHINMWHEYVHVHINICISREKERE